MANFNELAAYSITMGGDLPAHNYGGTDIPAGTGVLLDTVNIQGSNAAPGVVVPTAAGGVLATFGIAIETIPAGKNGRVRVYGGYPMICDGAVAVGAFVQISDTAGKMGRVKTKGAGLIQLGQALGTGADGDPILVLIDKAQNS